VLKTVLSCGVGLFLLAGCASTQRALLAERCEAKVQPFMRFAALLTKVPEPGKKVCGCIAERVDIGKAEALLLKPAGEERDAAVAALLVENGPMIRDCARATGVLP
jgi:hypothetical protein